MRTSIVIVMGVALAGCAHDNGDAPACTGDECMTSGQCCDGTVCEQVDLKLICCVSNGTVSPNGSDDAACCSSSAHQDPMGVWLCGAAQPTCAAAGAFCTVDGPTCCSFMCQFGSGSMAGTCR